MPNEGGFPKAETVTASEIPRVTTNVDGSITIAMQVTLESGAVWEHLLVPIHSKRVS